MDVDADVDVDVDVDVDADVDVNVDVYVYVYAVTELFHVVTDFVCSLVGLFIRLPKDSHKYKYI